MKKNKCDYILSNMRGMYKEETNAYKEFLAKNSKIIFNEEIQEALKKYIERIKSIKLDTEDVKHVHACASMDLFNILKKYM